MGEVLGRVIAETVPSVAEGLPPEVQQELEVMETFTDDELREIALSFLAEECSYSEGGAADVLMLRKAYANVILKWRGNPVNEKELQQACQST